MRTKILLIATLSFFVFGCAHKKPKEAESVSTPQATTAPTPPTTPSTASATATSSTTTCTLNKDKRLMEIETSTPVGCKLKYSNFNDNDPVAWSFKGIGHCESVRNQIRGTLESAGFKCDGEGVGTKAMDTPEKPPVTTQAPEPAKVKK